MKSSLLPEQSHVYHLAQKKYIFWAKKTSLLKKTIKQVLSEIKELDAIDTTQAETQIKKIAPRIKAVWVLSGIGTFYQPITKSPGDEIYQGESWAYYSDRQRIKTATELLKKIIEQNKVKKRNQQGGPYLIYNGISLQNQAIKHAIKSKDLSLPLSRLYIPKGKITKTLDQVKNLSFPDKKYDKGDIIIIVTHVAHYPRLLRMLERYHTVMKDFSIMLYPVWFKDKTASQKFTINEIMGVLGYIAIGEAAIKPIKYIKW